MGRPPYGPAGCRVDFHVRYPLSTMMVVKYAERAPAAAQTRSDGVRASSLDILPRYGLGASAYYLEG